MIEAMRETPRLSVVMVVGEERERARRAVAAVAAQSVGAAIELVVVDLRPDRRPVVEDVQLETTVIERPTETSWSAVRQAGAVAARAPVVAFVEDHVYAEPGWAEALLQTYDAHRDAVAVGYAFANARDGGRPDATLFAEYGRWVVPASGGRWSALPGNNVSYRRDALLELAGREAGALAVDFTLHAELLRRGSFLVASGAVVRHQGFPRLTDTMRANHEYGRVLAAARVARGSWSPARRALYAAGSPVVPLLNAARLARTLPGRGLWGSALRSAPTCLAIWAAAASGELVGYVTASGAEGERLLRWEVDVDRTTS
jgi:hypothetical protein